MKLMKRNRKTNSTSLFLAGMLLLPLLVLGSLLVPQSCRAGSLKIAVVPFDPLNALAKEENWGRQVGETLITSAVNARIFEVVERQMLEKLFSEQSMGQRDQTFTSTAQSVGNMLGADYILSGSVFASSKGRLRVDARLVDVGTGQVIVAKSFLSRDDLEDISQKADALIGDIRSELLGTDTATLADAGQEAGHAVEDTAGQKAGRDLEVIFLLYSKSGLEMKLSEAAELMQDDAYYILLKPRQRLFVYVAQVDSLGDVYPIFPNPAYAPFSNPLQPGKTYRIPSGRFFYLDEHTGKETIFSFGRPEALPEVEELFAQALSSGGAMDEAMLQRFQSSWQQAPAGAKDSLWFWHR